MNSSVNGGEISAIRGNRGWPGVVGRRGELVSPLRERMIYVSDIAFLLWSGEGGTEGIRV